MCLPSTHSKDRQQHEAAEHDHAAPQSTQTAVHGVYLAATNGLFRFRFPVIPSCLTGLVIQNPEI